MVKSLCLYLFCSSILFLHKPRRFSLHHHLLLNALILFFMLPLELFGLFDRLAAPFDSNCIQEDLNLFLLSHLIHGLLVLLSPLLNLDRLRQSLDAAILLSFCYSNISISLDLLDEGDLVCVRSRLLDL